MTPRQEKAEALIRLDEYLERIGFLIGRDPEIMDLAEELAMLRRAEAGDLLLDHALESRADRTIKQWRIDEINARHSLDAGFFDKIAKALKALKFLSGEVTANSPPAQLAVVAALQATRIISKQRTLPSWQYIRSMTELKLAGRYALVVQKNNSGSPEDASTFKTLAQKELNLFRKRARSREVKWNSIRKQIGLQGLLPDRLTPRERKELQIFKDKMLP